MSGGVDSSVAAWLLQRQGLRCVGATMKLYDNETVGRQGHPCCSLEDVEDARAVARQLGIPHYVFHFSQVFDDTVLRRFVEEYARGATPNPCIDCNRYLKFGRFLRRADELGLDGIATGHYARIVQDSESGRWLLKKAADPAKDQSYVLASMTQPQLSRTLFPLGALCKTEVRALAEAHGLYTARKHDSQDICFVPDGDYGAFLERYTGQVCPPGDILDEAGRVLGRHRGAVRYTLGQRRGLGLAAEQPLYVCGKSMADNTVTVGPERALYARGLAAADWNWIVPPPEGAFRAWGKVRYRQTEQPCTVLAAPDGAVHLTFDTPQRAITVGQAAVLYDGDTVLGGGTIIETIP